MVHLRTEREDYGATDARRVFVRELLAPLPEIAVQIADARGWNGYDDAKDAALGVLIESVRSGRVRAGPISFDLSAVVVDPRAAGGDSVLAARIRKANVRLATRTREVGGPLRLRVGLDELAADH